MSFRVVFFKLFFPVMLIGAYSCNTSEEPGVRTIAEELDSKKFEMPPLPDTVFFCGKEIMINNFDLKERLDKELLVNTYYHSSTIQSIKRAHKYFGLIEERLKKNGIPLDFKYLCLIESGLTQATSPSGAKGFWQFMPTTAREYDLLISNEVDERLSIQKSTDAACQYLKTAFSKFHDWSLVAASYNMGISGVQSELDSQQENSYYNLFLNNETSRYVFRILALKIILENKEDYGFYLNEDELYAPVQVQKVEINKPIPNLVEWAISNKTNYRMVKVLNPWILNDKIVNYPTPFYIEIPAN